MKVLQVVTDTDLRGAQIFARELHGPLVRRGHLLRTVALAPGVVGGLDLPALGQSGRKPQTFVRLRRLMRDADVVIAHGSTTLSACALAGVGTATPFVYRNLGDPLRWADSLSRRLRTAALLHRASAVVALWQGAAAALTQKLRVAPERVTIVPNGVDVARYRPATPQERAKARHDLGLADEAPTMAFVGALGPEKNVAHAVDAVAALDGAVLLVAGDGPARRDVQRRAETTAAERVFFLGSVEDPRPVYAAADCVVLPSQTEGLPATLIEAGLCGLPVVASDVGGVGEIVTSDTGALVPPGDVAALTEALRRALAEAATLGAAAEARCRTRFDLERVTDGWARVLEDVVAGRAVAGGSAAG